METRTAAVYNVKWYTDWH